MELLIYTPKITPRVNYIFQLFFDSLIKTPYKLSADEGKYKQWTGPKLNYSLNSFAPDELHIIPSGLLTETGIKKQKVEVIEWNRTGLKIFFGNEAGTLPFDIFSAAFYLVTRYEEFLSQKPDEHNRFKHTDSLAYKNNFLNEPIINLWAEELKESLLIKFPTLEIKTRKYSFVPTFDIDVAYAHLGRTTAITLGSFAKALSKFQFEFIGEKILVLCHLKKDPYDTYQYQQEIIEKNKLSPIYFILSGTRATHDKNISTANKYFINLIKKLSSFAQLGIHPSYHSESDAEVVEKEIAHLKRSTDQKIKLSRQHYLKLKLPETYLCLAKLNITDDYTMIYPGSPGFRAGICTPFYFYNLKAEQVMPVRVHSGIVMDGTLHEYMKIIREDAINTCTDLIKKVKKVNGEFIFIWHNHSLSQSGHWRGWRKVFEKIIEAGKE